MRLLNTKTLEFEEFFDADIPKYAILSHTWGKDECTFQSFPELRGKLLPTMGVKKVLDFCQLALNDGHPFAWIDTVCIDKRSSAELSEAINSMYRWYEQAARCHVYLSDCEHVDALSSSETTSLGDGVDSHRTLWPIWADSSMTLLHRELSSCRWFTRGWCLQELLAPKGPVVFYDVNWKPIGSSADSIFAQVISKITDIPVSVIWGTMAHQRFPFAQRMFWASKRKTSRLEDRAYSLLGIFGVNMPLIYGEGKNAFKRLQKEIISMVDDESIFAWWTGETDEPGWLNRRDVGGLLAESPDDFRLSQEISRGQFAFTGERPPSMITNKGLQIYVEDFGTKWHGEVLRLNCETDYSTRLVFLELFKVSEAEGILRFRRFLKRAPDRWHAPPRRDRRQVDLQAQPVWTPVYIEL